MGNGRRCADYCGCHLLRHADSRVKEGCAIFEDTIRSQLEGISATVNSMGQNSGLLSSLTDWNSTLAGYADSISTGVVMPVALTLLALFMILELYNATQRITLPNGASGFQGWYKDGEDTYGNVEWASLLYRMDWEELYGIVDGIKCRATGSGMTEEELRQLFASLNIDATTARGQVVAFALSCQGKFVYAQPSSLRGGPGSPSVGINLDCSSFVQYCYWAQNLPFSAGSTAAYRNAADLVSISTSEVQPGDLRVVYASGGEQGHVQMALGGDAWIECCYGYGVAVNMSNAWMESRPCYYFRYAGF